MQFLLKMMHPIRFHIWLFLVILVHMLAKTYLAPSKLKAFPHFYMQLLSMVCDKLELAVNFDGSVEIVFHSSIQVLSTFAIQNGLQSIESK